MSLDYLANQSINLFETDSYSNEYLLPKFGFDTAENELNHQRLRVKYYYSHSSFRTPPVPSVFEDNPVYRRRRRRERALQS